ncbi:MAG: hypothetical protein NVS2B3_08040 [Vulcanimicrobiaceae bacterium]
MNDSNDPRRDDGRQTIEEAVEDHAKIYAETFGLSPETARLTAEDSVASRERNPASDDVDEERAARARAQEKRA